MRLSPRVLSLFPFKVCVDNTLDTQRPSCFHTGERPDSRLSSSDFL